MSAACAAIILSTTAIAGEIPANIKAGIDNPNRKEENIARDGGEPLGAVSIFRLDATAMLVERLDARRLEATDQARLPPRADADTYARTSSFPGR